MSRYETVRLVIASVLALLLSVVLPLAARGANGTSRTTEQFDGFTDLDIYVDEEGKVNCRPIIEGHIDDPVDPNTPTANLAYDAFLTDPNNVNHGQSRVRWGWIQEDGIVGTWSCTSDFYVNFDQSMLGEGSARRIVYLEVQ